MSTPLSALMDRFFNKHEKTARDAAKDRLRMVLMHDRADIPAPVLEQIRAGFMSVLAKHLDFDENLLEVSLEKADNTSALVVSIPIRGVRK